MDLLTLSKKAIQNPLHYHNFFVLFVTTFIILVLGLSIVSLTSKLLTQVSSVTACDSAQNKKIAGRALSSDDVIYQLNYKGNSQCFLAAFLTWKEPREAITLWVYDPSGKIEVVEPSEKQTHTQFYKASPLSSGEWKFVIKAANGTQVDYSGNLSVQ